jgi:DNA-binding transcriptional LysR family regulator
MELRDIEYFAVVAEHDNVRRASEALNLSPPAGRPLIEILKKTAEDTANG